MLNLVALVAKTGSKIDLLGRREFFLRRRALGVATPKTQRQNQHMGKTEKGRNPCCRWNRTPSFAVL